MHSDWKAKQLWYRVRKDPPEFTDDWAVKAWPRLVNIIDRGIYGECSNDIDYNSNVNLRVTDQLSKTLPTPDVSKLIKDPRKLVLLTQLYITGDKSRDSELLNTIKSNIDNLLIDKIILFVHKDIDDSILKKYEENKEVEVYEHDKAMLTYDDIFKYCLNQKTDYIYLLTNTDCSFDKSVSLLKNLDYKNPVFYTMTRYENYYGKGYDVGKDIQVYANYVSKNIPLRRIPHSEYGSLPYIEPWSFDACAFDSKLLKELKKQSIDCDIEIGTELCEIILQYRLHESGIGMKNVGFHGHIKCYHNHASQVRNPSNWPGKEAAKLLPGIYPTGETPRKITNSIQGCYRLRSKHNWLDKDTLWHEYSDFVVHDLTTVLSKATSKSSETDSVNNMCVLYLCTAKELQQGMLQASVENFLRNVESDKKVDLIFCMDQKHKNHTDLYKYKSHENINKVIVKCFNIPDNKNIYTRPWLHPPEEIEQLEVPELGLSSGPNELFYQTCEYMSSKHYKYYLMLEADCIPVSVDWLDHYLTKCDESNDWVLLSSIYKGEDENNNNQWHSDSPYLNGVGLYKNNKRLRQLMNNSRKLVLQFVQENRFQRFINYDTATGHHIMCYEPWNKQLVYDSDCIVNMSPSRDKDVDIATVLKQFPDARLLHNKRSDYSNHLKNE